MARAVETIVTAQLCKWRPALLAPDTLTQRGLRSCEPSGCVPPQLPARACALARACLPLSTPLHSTHAAGDAGERSRRHDLAARGGYFFELRDRPLWSANLHELILKEREREKSSNLHELISREIEREREVDKGESVCKLIKRTQVYNGDSVHERHAGSGLGAGADVRRWCLCGRIKGSAAGLAERFRPAFWRAAAAHACLRERQALEVTVEVDAKCLHFLQRHQGGLVLLL